MEANPDAFGRRARSSRLVSFAAISVVMGLIALACYFFPWRDDGHRTASLVGCAALAAAALAGWIVFCSGVSWRLRVILLLPFAALAASVKPTGCTGNIAPEFGWRWSSKYDEALAKAGGSRVVNAIADVGSLTGREPDDYPQFLGPNRDGSLRDAQLAADWDNGPPEKVWRQPIGAGFSAFAVAGEFAFTQEQRGASEVVSCYEARTGKLRWTHDEGEPPFESTMGGDGPRATPTVSQGRVYVMGARGRLECLDAADGQAIWTHEVLKEADAPLPQWAISGSPLVVDGLVIVSAGGGDGRSLLAFDAADGIERWRAGDAPMSYATPVLAELGGTRQVVVLNADQATGHELSSGRVLWSVPWSGGEPKVPQPIIVGTDRILLSAGYGLGCRMIRVTPAVDSWNTEEMWTSRALKPKFTNLVQLDGHVYGLDDGRVLLCMSLDDGKIRWRGGRYGHGQVLLIGSTLLVQTEDGELVLVEANPQRHVELARFAALADRTWNPPAFSPPYLLVRNHLEAACYKLPLATPE